VVVKICILVILRKSLNSPQLAEGKDSFEQLNFVARELSSMKGECSFEVAFACKVIIFIVYFLYLLFQSLYTNNQSFICLQSLV